MTTAVTSTWVASLELSMPDGLEDPCEDHLETCEVLRVLVRLHGEPMGFVELPAAPDGRVEPAVLTRAIVTQLRAPVSEHLRLHGEPSRAEDLETSLADLAGREWCEGPGDEALPAVSVVVCTRDRPEALARCLASLQALAYPDFEVVVVDNAPRDASTRTTVEVLARGDGRFRYCEEPMPGLSRARNRGLAQSRHATVAFTDDDVVVDRWWLHGLARGFARAPQVACVTGIAPAGRLESFSEHYFDERVSWSSTLNRRLFDLGENRGPTPIFPLDAGQLGTGANFAVRRDLVVSLGGFDAALGVGSPAAGGEDLDLFVRVVRAGYAIAFEPSALVWHFARASKDELHRQMRNYGSGLGAYLTKQLSQPWARRVLLLHGPPAAWRLLRHWSRGGERGGGSPELLVNWIAGFVAGPWAYWSGRRRGRRSAPP